MAVVYLAEQTEPVKRQVAIKIIKLGMDTKQVTARFESERQALAVLDHPNIAKVFDGGVTDSGRSYFVMERVHGIPITDYCDNARLSTKERIQLFMDVCSAVQHAHLKGLVHRDLKPSNILVAATDGTPQVKIIDFGIAKATGTSFTEKTLFTKIGQIIGTPQYMSPEQAGITGLDVDTRSDIYSLGVILYELLVGALPLELTALGEQAIRLALLEKDPPKPSTRITQLDDTKEEIAKARNTDVQSLRRLLSGDLDWIVLRAMAKDRTRRYETANALAMECRRFLEHQPILARPPSAGYVLGRFIRRNRTTVAAASIAILAIIAGATAATIGFIRATEAERVAIREAETARQTSDFLVELFRVSDPSEARGNSITAREILDRGADRVRQELSSEPQVQSVLMNTMGAVYANIGLYGESQALLDDALVASESIHGRRSSEVAQVLFELGELARHRGNYAQAELLHKESLSIRREVPDTNNLSVAASLHGLGLALYYGSKYEEAEDALRESLELYSADSDTKAEYIASVQSSLAGLMHSTSRYDEAEALFKKSLSLFRQRYGDYHPEVASDLSDLALIYQDVGQLDEAEAAFKESIGIFRKLYQDEHPFIAETEAHLASVLAEKGDMEGAEAIFRSSIAMLERTVGNEHMLTARVHDSLGLLLLSQRRYDEAEPELLESVKLHRSLLGDNHINTGRAINNMAALLFLSGDYARAEPYFRESLSIRRQHLDEGDADLANSKNNLADVLNRLGEYTEAESLASEAAETYATVFAPTHWRAAVARNVHGRSLAGLQRYEEAEELILESNAIIAETRQGSIYHRLALERTIELYDAWGKPAIGAEYQQKLDCLEKGKTC
jgi:non-specific serine/threonine protein kinase/serine/threonine-protein kinase